MRLEWLYKDSSGFTKAGVALQRLEWLYERVALLCAELPGDTPPGCRTYSLRSCEANVRATLAAISSESSREALSGCCPP